MTLIQSAEQYRTSVTQNMSHVALSRDGTSLNALQLYLPQVTFGSFQSANVSDRELSFSLNRTSVKREKIENAR